MPLGTSFESLSRSLADFASLIDETKESPPGGGPMVVVEEEEASAAVPLFFLAFFLLGSAAPSERFGLDKDDCAVMLGGNGRFWGLVWMPALFGGTIFPDAGSFGRDGRCLRGSSTSSRRGSSPLTCSFCMKKLCTRPICEGND